MTRQSIGRFTGPLIDDSAERAATEARNALLQFDEVRRLIAERPHALNLTPIDLCRLQGIAVFRVHENPGKFRQTPVEISNTPHLPPPHEEVESLVEEMCGYANSVADNALHVSAYLMWRLNWVHPFEDGNGRTSRAVSYLALCCGYGMELPGTVTVPDLIVRNKQPYYQALDSADAAWKNGELDVSIMESLIEELLTQQLQTAV